MRRARRPTGGAPGFTLLEMAAVLAVLGVLVVVSIGPYTNYYYQAQSGEAVLNVRTIAALEQGRVGGAIGCAPSPAEVPSAEPAAWVASEGFDELGYRPGQDTLYQYEVEVPGPDEAAFVVRARGDLDGDGDQSLFELRADRSDLRIERGSE